jgi:hypothetical protein
MRLPRFARKDGLPRPFRARNDIVRIYIAFILVQKKLLSVKIGKILEGGTGVKAIQVKNVKSKSELKNFIHFPWKVYRSDRDWIPPQFWKREKLTFRDVKGR